MIITPNLPELKRLNMWVQEQDKLEPGARIWEQGLWVTIREETPMCQTAYCVCGMAIVRAGHEFTTRRFGPDPDYDLEMLLDGQHIDHEAVADMGAELLGLSEMVADDLFYEGNSAADIERIIRDIFFAAGASYDATEPAPNFEIEIKAIEVEINAAEIAQGHLKLTNKLINA